MSLHLLQPIVATTLTSPVTAGAAQTASVGSSSYTYPGAMLLVNDPLNIEVVTVITVPNATSFTADFAFSHAAAVDIQAATFPSQALTDPLLTQSEILNYIARAQNELLAKCPGIVDINYQTIGFGQTYQTLTPTTIEMHRVATSSSTVTLTSLTRSSGTVTALTPDPHGYIAGQKFSILSTTDSTFLGAFKIATVPTTTTWTYPQALADAVSSGGIAGLWVRAYEVSQEELGNQNPRWKLGTLNKISSWFEDRTGLYTWGVNGVPASNFPAEVLTTIRDSDTLTLSDGLLVPDLIVHLVKYRALQYCWEKDGEIRNPAAAKYCEMRFQRGVLALRRWLSWAGVEITDRDTMMAGTKG